MNWLDKLERKFGRYAIDNLMSYIVAANAAILLIYTMVPYVGISIMDRLSFVPHFVLRGEVWRFITFIFIPPNTGFWGVIALVFYYSISRALESQWGPSGLISIIY